MERDRTIQKLEKEINEEKLANEKQRKFLDFKTHELARTKEALQKIFTPAQVARIFSGKQAHWDEVDLSKAIVILGLSPKAYAYLRDECNLPLPSISSVKRYLANIEIQPGVLQCLINIMSIEGQKMTELERVVALSFDEVMIARRYSYDVKNDQVLEPKRSLQVVFARGIFKNWKEPVFFDFDCPMTETIVDEILVSLHKAGFSVISLACDLGKSNISLYTKKGVTSEKPYFEHPITKQPVFCIFDPPHQLKLGRNHLLDRGYDLNPALKRNKQLATTEPIKQLFTAVGVIDFGQLSITPHHLTVKGPQRQDVRKACQVLSNKTARGLMIAGQAGVLNAKNYEVS